MRKILFLVLVFILGCKTLPKPIDQQKAVKFKQVGKPSYFSPTFKSTLDSNNNFSCIVRTISEPISDIVSENLKFEENIIDLENSLVTNHFIVFDRPFYQNLKNIDKNTQAPFKFILEITRIESTKHYTGIIFYNLQKHYLEGKIMQVKIINAENGKILGLITAEFVPCISGCNITYNQYKIIDVLENKKNDKMNLSLSDQITHSILKELNNK